MVLLALLLDFDHVLALLARDLADPAVLAALTQALGEAVQPFEQKPGELCRGNP